MTGTVLVCGAGGFLGSHAMRAFEARQWRVAAAGRASFEPAEAPSAFEAGELEDAPYVERLMQRSEPTHVLYVAGPASVQASFDPSAGGEAAHLAPLRTVLQFAMRQHAPPKVLLVSSAAVYGNPDRLPVDESFALAPISPYGAYKQAQEELIRKFASDAGMRASIARPFSTYGPGAKRLAVWDIATRALRGDFSLRGSGDESRDYLFAPELAAALCHLMEAAPFRSEVVNIGSGEETRIGDLAAQIYRRLNIDATPVFDGEQLPGSPLRWRASIGRLRSLGWNQVSDPLGGLGETLDWVRANA